MPESSSDAQTTEISRRVLLGRGAALVGAAVAGAALPSATAAAEPPALHGALNGMAKDAKPSALPNLDPPVVQLQAGKLRGFRDAWAFLMPSQGFTGANKNAWEPAGDRQPPRRCIR